LGDPLTDLLLLVQVDRFSEVVYGHLLPCLKVFHQCISDDYQMKTINLKIMTLLKHKNTKIHKAVFELTDQLIDSLQDRFLLLVNDLIPFLLESASSRNEAIAKVVRKIISKIE
jgi:U3 small nucleolar RNA-associated protein 10